MANQDVFKEELVEANDEPSILEEERVLNEKSEVEGVLGEVDEGVFEEEIEVEEEEEVLEANSKKSIFTRAASILSHFLLLHWDLSFLAQHLLNWKKTTQIEIGSQSEGIERFQGQKRSHTQHGSCE